MNNLHLIDQTRSSFGTSCREIVLKLTHINKQQEFELISENTCNFVPLQSLIETSKYNGNNS